MTLSPGTRLGPYEILSPLGAGGMGEVYKARDTRLARDVAVKVLPSHLSDSPDLKARFEREARAVAALSHPHICAIYDVGEAPVIASEAKQSTSGSDRHGLSGLAMTGPVQYLVMELLEGQTLADRLEKGALPSEQVLKLGIEIAGALDKAHRSGIIHRDLKPGNVMLTKSGVKLLDFGLAKTLLPSPGGRGAGGEGVSALPTEADRPLTEKGTIMGTFQYMAPEQLEGKEADARTDIFAFGCVLYEMTTGKKAFSGTSRASLIGAIMNTEPPSISTVQPMTPPALDHVVRRCLAKDPEDRWQSAADVASELRWVAEAGSQAGAPASVVLRRKSRERIAWGLAAGLAIALVIAASIALQAIRKRSNFESRVMQMTLPVPKGERLAYGQGAFAISPDGSKVALLVNRGVSQKLLLHSIENGSTADIPGTEDAYYPFSFSPDGKWIGFAAGNKIKKVAIAGGAPIALADAPFCRGLAWGDDGFIYFVASQSLGVNRLPESGGPVRPVSKIRTAEGEFLHRWPDVAPGGKTIVYAAGHGTDWDEAKIVAERLDTGIRRVIIEGGTSPRILPGGILVYAKAGSLYAVAFDPESLACSGAPVEVARNVLTDNTGFAYADFSSAGVLLTSPADAATNALALSWIDRNGKATPLHVPRQAFISVSLSTNARAAAVQVGNSVAIVDIARETLTRIPLPARANSPVLSPDGRTLYFALEKEKWYTIFSKPTDGSRPEEALFPAEASELPRQVSRDGKSLLTSVGLPSGEVELRLHDLSGEHHEHRATVRSAALGGNGSLSPDARWVSYDSSESGQLQVYAQRIEGEARRFQVSTDTGGGPIWSYDGREIFYERGSQIFAVSVEEQGTELQVGPPKLLFENHEILGGADVDPTGTKFLVAENPNFGTPQSLDVTVNWFAEVRKKLREAKAP